MKKEIMFSIIVPIYNVEKYLEKCIESVLSQTYTNYEIILVDDGSPDSCSRICDTYSTKYPFIRTIHKENGGLSDARNKGLEKVKGKYTIFLDSDDFWNETKLLEDVANRNNNEDLIVINSYKYYDENSNAEPRFRLDKSFYDKNDNEKILYLIKNNIYKACAWDKIIKTSILIDNNIKFPIGMLSEDMIWAGELLEKVSTVTVYEKPVYAYRQRNNSISKKVGEKHLKDILQQITTGTKTANEIVLNYYAYEYSVLLGFSFKTKDKEILQQIKDLKWLLKYDVSDKVKLVKYMSMLTGLKLTRLFLYIYINKNSR